MTLGVVCILAASSVQDSARVALARLRKFHIHNAHLSNERIASRLPKVWIVIALLMIAILGLAAWSWIDSTYVYEYVDDRGEKGTLPRIEAPRPPATPPPRSRHRYNAFAGLRSLYAYATG